MGNRSISLEEAVEKMLHSVQPLRPVEKDILSARGDVLAEDVVACIAQPPFPRSPLDGYAFRAQDSVGAQKESPVVLKVVDKIYAGGYSKVCVGKGEAVRLMTGAMIPEGADCVIRQEDTNEDEAFVEIYKALQPFDNYCFKGEDYEEGTVLLNKGTCLDFAAVGVLASNGTQKVTVVKKPSVAIITTGDELTAPGDTLKEGKIYNSNQFLLLARLQQLGYECAAYHIDDEAEVVVQQISRLAKKYDAIITTGGVSVGQKDIINEVLPMLGAEVFFHGIALKPGSPAKYALYKGKPIIALSGNPFAAAVTFELLARPVLQKLSGKETQGYESQKAVLATDFGKASKNRRFVRGYYKDSKVSLPKGHSSGQLRSMVGCNCLIDIPAGSGELRQGDCVTVVML